MADNPAAGIAPEEGNPAGVADSRVAVADSQAAEAAPAGNPAVVALVRTVAAVAPAVPEPVVAGDSRVAAVVAVGIAAVAVVAPVGTVAVAAVAAPVGTVAPGLRLCSARISGKTSRHLELEYHSCCKMPLTNAPFFVGLIWPGLPVHQHVKQDDKIGFY